jgi:hypothetical protein
VVGLNLIGSALTPVSLQSSDSDSPSVKHRTNKPFSPGFNSNGDLPNNWVVESLDPLSGMLHKSQVAKH